MSGRFESEYKREMGALGFTPAQKQEIALQAAEAAWEAKSAPAARRPVARRMAAACGSVLAFVGAFLIFGFTNPALASEIPLLGNLFKQVNGESKYYGPANLESYGAAQEVDVLAKAENTDSELRVISAYSDGETVWAGMELTLPEDLANRYRWVSTDYAKDCAAWVNGEPSPSISVEGFDFYGGKLAGMMYIDVPENQKKAEEFQVSFQLKGLLGRLTEEIAGNEVTDEALDWSFAGEFPVQGEKGETLFSLACQAEDNGAKVFFVSGTPSQTRISIEKPYWGEVGGREVLDAPDSYPKGFPELYTAAGEEIRIDDGKTYVQKGENQAHGNYDMYCRETQRADLYFDGVPAGTKQMILRFREGESERVMAEFTIDLENETITPAGTAPVDEEKPAYETAACFQKGPEENGYSVEDVRVLSNGQESIGAVQFSTRSGSVENPEQLRVEVRDAEGGLLFASNSVTETGEWNETEWATGRDSLDASPDDAPTCYSINTQNAVVPGSVRELLGEKVTTAIISLESGETLCTDVRTLDDLQD